MGFYIWHSLAEMNISTFLSLIIQKQPHFPSFFHDPHIFPISSPYLPIPSGNFLHFAIEAPLPIVFIVDLPNQKNGGYLSIVPGHPRPHRPRADGVCRPVPCLAAPCWWFCHWDPSRSYPLPATSSNLPRLVKGWWNLWEKQKTKAGSHGEMEKMWETYGKNYELREI